MKNAGIRAWLRRLFSPRRGARRPDGGLQARLAIRAENARRRGLPENKPDLSGLRRGR